MVNARKKNFSPLPAGNYRNSTKRSTRRHHQANDGESGSDADRVRALQALHSLGSKKKLAAEKLQEMHILSNEDKDKWIEDYVETETAGARQQVVDAEETIGQE